MEYLVCVCERVSEAPQHKCYIPQVLQSRTLPNIEDAFPLSVIFGSVAKVRNNRQNLHKTCLFSFFFFFFLQTGKALNDLFENVNKLLKFKMRESESWRKRVRNPELQNQWFWSVTLLLIESLTQWKIDLAAVQNRCDLYTRPQRPLRESERVRSELIETGCAWSPHTDTHTCHLLLNSPGVRFSESEQS